MGHIVHEIAVLPSITMGHPRRYTVVRPSRSVIEPEEIFVDAVVEFSGDPVSASRLEYPLARHFARAFISIVGLAMLSLLLVAAKLQIGDGAQYAAVAERNRIRVLSTRAPRGVLYDRFLRPLVKNVPRFDIMVLPIELPRNSQERERILSTLASTLDMPVRGITDAIGARGEYSSEPLLLAPNIDRERALLLEARADDFSGIRVVSNTLRAYPKGEIFAHLIGFTGLVTSDILRASPEYELTDEVGKSGIERAYEETVKGKNAIKHIERDSTGEILREGVVQEAIPGRSVVLGVDAELQERLFHALRQEMERRGAPAAAAVAMDPTTGSVRALVSLPSFDPNIFARGTPQDEIARLLSDPAQPLFDRVVSGTYPPGSTIKPFVAIAALGEHIIEPLRRIYAAGAITVPNQFDPRVVYTFSDWKTHGLITMPEAIAQSSNVYFYTVGGGNGGIQGLGPERLARYLKKFHFDQLFGIDYPGETVGYIPTPQDKERRAGEPWYVGDTYHMAIGQGDVIVTPLALAAAVGAIANGGTLYKPMFVERILGGENVEGTSFEPTILADALAPPPDIRIVQRGMRMAVESGSARGLSSISVAVAAKTGTAQTGRKTAPHAWIAAYAPAEKPSLVLVVLLEEGGEGSGGAQAVARSVLSWYFTSRHECGQQPC
ncbi:MAG: penicillin-binding protein 2 [Parcubacteria group bacterium]|nr:penicillin-binding protein 2 [Parcubacteria group bacterium]